MTVDVVIPALDEELALARVLADLPRPGTAIGTGAAAPRGPHEPAPPAPGATPPPSAAAATLREAVVAGPPVPSATLRAIVVADNGSRDRTADVARAAGARVVSEPRRGYGAACLAALAAIRPAPPDIVAFLDADHSDDPRELPLVLAPLLADRADLVVGSRTLGALEPGAFTPSQRFGNALAPALLRLFWGATATDLGPFRAIRWEALERLRMRDRDYGWTVEMQARAYAAGLRVAEVPVSCRRRRLGRSKVSGTVRGVLGAGTKILWTIARVRLGG